ncbi:MAG: ABC transporter substrate-binding protein [Bacillota bacterium]
MKRFWFCVLAVVLVLGVLASCGPAEEAEPADEPGEEEAEPTPAPEEETPTHLRFSRGPDLEGWGTYCTSTGALYDLQRNVIEPLAEYSWHTYQYEPVLAESWDIEDEGQTWVFNLRRGVHFHDGSEFTADDVLHSWDRILNDPDSDQQHHWNDVESITSTDDYTVVFHLERTRPDFINQVTNAFVTSKTTYDEVGRDEANRRLIGTGPFTFVEWRTGSYVVLDRNDEYWDEDLNTPFERITYRPIADKSAAMAALEAGEIDLVDGVPAHEVDRLAGIPGLEIMTCRSDRLWFNGLNPGVEPMDDVRVRRAVQHAIDVDRLIDTVLEGRAIRAPQYMAEGTPGYIPDLELYEYDTERARELIDEAGYVDGIHDLDFYSISWVDGYLDLALGSQPMLEEAGIYTTIQTPERGVYSDLFTAGQMALYNQGRGNTTTAGVQYLRQYFETGITDRLLYSNPEVDSLLQSAAAAIDTSERDRLTQEAVRLIYADSPMMPLVWPDLTYAGRDWVDFTATPDEYVRAFRIGVK